MSDDSGLGFGGGIRMVRFRLVIDGIFDGVVEEWVYFKNYLFSGLDVECNRK